MQSTYWFGTQYMKYLAREGVIKVFHDLMDTPAGLGRTKLEGHDVVLLLPLDGLAHHGLNAVHRQLLRPLFGSQPHLVQLHLECQPYLDLGK